MSESKQKLITDNYEQIRKWVEDGLFEKQIYNNLGMGKTTWEKYKKQLPELQKILTEGVKVPVIEVANALYKNATGYNYIVEESAKCKEIYYDEEGRRCEREVLKTVQLLKHQPAKTDAQKFFLINKARDLYSLNPQEIERKKQEFKQRMEVEQFKSF